MSSPAKYHSFIAAGMIERASLFLAKSGNRRLEKTSRKGLTFSLVSFQIALQSSGSM